MKRCRFMLVSLAVLAVSIAAYGQTAPSGQTNDQQPASGNKKNDGTTADAQAGTPVAIKVLVSEFDGATKISSLPYTLHTVTWPRNVSHCPAPGSMRYDVNVTLPGGGHARLDMDIDYGACERGGGEFDVPITINRESLEPTASAATSNGPLTPFFRAGSSLVLRNGQTAEAVSAVDPATGHVLKVDVTLTVLK